MLGERKQFCFLAGPASFHVSGEIIIIIIFFFFFFVFQCDGQHQKAFKRWVENLNLLRKIEDQIIFLQI